MNKYEEALRDIRHLLFINGAMGYEENIKTIEELIDKTIPMKPAYIDGCVDEYGELFIIGDCGACGWSINDGQKRCENCGQVIDWS